MRMPNRPPSRSRPLTPGEIALAERVFGDALDTRNLRVVRRAWGRFAFVIGDRIHVPPGAPADFAAAPLHTQAWLVHELVHAWQFQTGAWRTLASWLWVVATGGYGKGLPGYAYRLPPKPWRRCNLEQQARLVEHQFLLQAGCRCPTMPAGATLADYAEITPFGRNLREIMDKAGHPTQA